jgi:hypothetical protein
MFTDESSSQLLFSTVLTSGELSPFSISTSMMFYSAYTYYILGVTIYYSILGNANSGLSPCLPTLFILLDLLSSFNSFDDFFLCDESKY